MTLIFLYVHNYEGFGFIIVSQFFEISFFSRFIEVFVETVLTIKTKISVFSSIRSLKANKKGITKNLEKLRHDFVDTSFVNTFTKKSTDLRENLIRFNGLNVIWCRRFVVLVIINVFHLTINRMHFTSLFTNPF